MVWANVNDNDNDVDVDDYYDDADDLLTCPCPCFSRSTMHMSVMGPRLV